MSEQIEIPMNGNENETPFLDEDGTQDYFNFNLLRLDGSNSNKRRSPEVTTLFTAPMISSKKPKKVLFQDHDPQETKNSSSSHYCNGFSKISVPFSRLEDVSQMKTLTQSVNSVASLRRCVSDPSKSENVLEANVGSGGNLFPQSPPESGKNVSGNVTVTPASKETLPPRPVEFRRSVSDPSPKTSFSRSSSSCNEMGVDGSPSFENLRKLKSYMKEMNQWMEEIVPDQVTCEDEHGNEDEIKCDSVKNDEEAVSIERVGNCLIIHFNCPCGKGYQILLTGTSCYYKLM